MSLPLDDLADHYRTIIQGLGEDPDREGLQNTPMRAAKAMQFLTRGYQQDLEELVNNAVFESAMDEMVVIQDIELYSMCEHHMLPFIGTAHIAYYPSEGVVGLSKLARVVDIFSKRLQTQENLTAQIASAIDGSLAPRGLAVMLEAEHQCMTMRGVQKPGVSTITTRFTGVFEDNAGEQAKFMSLVRG